MSARSRRELAAAVATCLAAAGLLLIASRQTWLHETVRRSALLPAARVARRGAEVTGAPRAVGWLALAGAVAIVATRRWARTAVGLVLAVAALGALGATLGVLGRANGWGWAAAAGLALLLADGLVVAARGRRWPGLGSRYDAPNRSGRPIRSPGSPQELWDALDRGEDPTDRG